MSEAGLKADLARLVGEENLRDDPAVLAAFSVDYGGITRKRPRLVVRPRSAAEVAQVVGYAYRQELPISPRAGGFSFSGQALNEDGIALDMRELAGVGPLDTEGGTYEALAGTQWKDVVEATTGAGFVPPALTSYLRTSIGGTLSAAGFSMSSARFGTQVDHCLELEVATHEGKLVRCSAETDKELFEHVLCGFGQFGVITRARQRMRRAAPQVRTYFLQYDDLAAHLADQARLVEEKRVTFIDGMVRSCYHGLRMVDGRRVPFHSHLYPLNVTVEFAAGEPPDDERILSGLGFSKWIYAEDLDLADFLLVGHTDEVANPRIAEIFVDVLVPWSAVESFLRKVEAHIFPRIVHVEHTILWPMTRATLTRPLLKVPDEGMFMGIGLYSRVPTNGAAQAVAASKAFVELAVKMGGTYYLTGSVRLDAARFAHQFGAGWPAVRELKRRYDPKGLFNPGFFLWPDP